MFRRTDTKAFIHKSLSALMPVILLGCSTMPLGTGEALAQSSLGQDTVVQSDMSSQLMFELMIADLAIQRGQLDVALEGYLLAAERTADARVPEQAARLAMYGRQWSEAERMAQRWIALDPSNKQAPGLLARALLRQGKVEPAFILYKDAMDASANKGQTLRDIQFDLQEGSNASVSVAIMQRLGEAYPNEPEALIGLTRAHIVNNDSASALAAVETAVERSPNNIDALLLRTHILASTDELEKGLALLKTAVDKNPDNTQLRLGYVQILVQSGRFDEVGVELQQAYSESTDDAQIRLNIAVLAMEAEQFDQAEGFFADLLITGEYADQANFNLGRINDQQLEYSTAIEFYDAVGNGELFFNSRLRAAELTAIAGELGEGRSRLNDLTAIVENRELQPRIIAVESRMLQNDDQHASAVEVLTNGLEMFPEDSSLLYSRALAAFAAGDPSTMVTDLERLIVLTPENAHALNALGYHFADENIELERAEKLLGKATELLPADPAIMDSLGWLRFRQGRFDEAIELLQQAYAVFPDPEVVAHLAEALMGAGQSEQAKELVEAALLEHSDDERLLEIQSELNK